MLQTSGSVFGTQKCFALNKKLEFVFYILGLDSNNKTRLIMIH